MNVGAGDYRGTVLVNRPRDCLNTEDAPHLEALGRLLNASWPTLITFTPEAIGLAALPNTKFDFLQSIQSLTDAGLMSYEALVVGSEQGPRVVDAALTARGRLIFRSPA